MRTCNMLLASACAIALGTSVLRAQSATKPFEILDNSFLVEEAFNQEAHVFQNILTAQRFTATDWNFTFTQEWPLGGMRHQLSYTLAMTDAASRVELGTTALNYRLQLREESAHGPALSPRLSLLLPTSPGAKNAGLQINVPLSKQFGDFYVHLNGGYTFNNLRSSEPLTRQRTAAASVIYRLLPMFNLMLESTFATHQYAFESSWYVSPGFRVGKNLGNKQVVFGLAMPMGLLDLDDKRTLFGYFSYELPF